MRSRNALSPFLCAALLFSSGFSQDKPPNELRAAARALTVGDLLGVADRASQGDTDSQLMIGISLEMVAQRIHFDPKARGQTLQLSSYWLRQAAEKGSPPARYFLAQTDWELADKCDEVSPLLDKAISQGYLPAMTTLGRLHLDGGCGFKLDSSLGLQWLRKASLAGDAEANYWIGRSYEQGQGVKSDEVEATRWFRKGSQLGDPSSQNALGINLAEGHGSPKNSEQAVDWFRKSAEQGNYEAACNLALHNIRGEGVAKDYVAALTWGLIADRNATDIGCLSEIDTTDLLTLTTAQEAEATERANNWLRSHHYPLTDAPGRTEPPKGVN